jgi:hypothetical protein
MPLGFLRLALGLAICAALGGGAIAVVAQDAATAVTPAATPTPEQVLAGKRV